MEAHKVALELKDIFKLLKASQSKKHLQEFLDEKGLELKLAAKSTDDEDYEAKPTLKLMPDPHEVSDRAKQKRKKKEEDPKDIIERERKEEEEAKKKRDLKQKVKDIAFKGKEKDEMSKNLEKQIGTHKYKNERERIRGYLDDIDFDKYPAFSYLKDKSKRESLVADIAYEVANTALGFQRGVKPFDLDEGLARGLKKSFESIGKMSVKGGDDFSVEDSANVFDAFNQWYESNPKSLKENRKIKELKESIKAEKGGEVEDETGKKLKKKVDEKKVKKLEAELQKEIEKILSKKISQKIRDFSKEGKGEGASSKNRDEKIDELLKKREQAQRQYESDLKIYEKNKKENNWELAESAFVHMQKMKKQVEKFENQLRGLKYRVERTPAIEVHKQELERLEKEIARHKKQQESVSGAGEKEKIEKALEPLLKRKEHAEESIKKLEKEMEKFKGDKGKVDWRKVDSLKEDIKEIGKQIDELSDKKAEAETKEEYDKIEQEIQSLESKIKSREQAIVKLKEESDLEHEDVSRTDPETGETTVEFKDVKQMIENSQRDFNVLDKERENFHDLFVKTIKDPSNHVKNPDNAVAVFNLINEYNPRDFKGKTDPVEVAKYLKNYLESHKHQKLLEEHKIKEKSLPEDERGKAKPPKREDVKVKVNVDAIDKIIHEQFPEILYMMGLELTRRSVAQGKGENTQFLELLDKEFEGGFLDNAKKPVKYYHKWRDMLRSKPKEKVSSIFDELEQFVIREAQIQKINNIFDGLEKTAVDKQAYEILKVVNSLEKLASSL